MTDVRLTATNPEDSSVVPVGCNSRGELLIEEVVIEQIENDLTLEGSLAIKAPEEANGGVAWLFSKSSGNLTCVLSSSGLTSHRLKYEGTSTHTRTRSEQPHNVEICSNNRAYRQWIGDGASNYWIDWSGSTTGTRFQIMLEPNNPVHFSSVRDVETGEETKEYIGPVIDVREELEFLRSQVRALMEKLKMTPEGGWPVWDGSTET